MDLSTFGMNFQNNIQFEERIYNNSGINTEHAELLHTMQTNTSNNFNVNFSHIEHIDALDQFGCYQLDGIQSIFPGLEIITVDPDSIYSSEDDFEEHIDVHTDNAISNDIIEVDPYEKRIRRQTESCTFDISDINLNAFIDDDAFLFGGDQSHANNFDLASYIADETITSNLLLSPPPAASASISCRILNKTHSKLEIPSKTAVKKVSLLAKTITFDGVRAEASANRNQRNLQRDEQQLEPEKLKVSMPFQTSSTEKRCTRMTKRKLKNISKEFIDDSSDDGNNSDAHIDVEDTSDVKNGNCNGRPLRKLKKPENDPTWDPDHRNIIKAANEQKKIRTLLNYSEPIPIPPKELSKKDKAKQVPVQSSGLRTIMKQHLMSNCKKSLTKTLATKLQTSTAASNVARGLIQKPKSSIPSRTVGLGRGKDIKITAKYYNRTDSSDDETVIELPSNKHRKCNNGIDKHESNNSSDEEEDDARKSSESKSISSVNSLMDISKNANDELLGETIHKIDDKSGDNHVLETTTTSANINNTTNADYSSSDTEGSIENATKATKNINNININEKNSKEISVDTTRIVAPKSTKMSNTIISIFNQSSNDTANKKQMPSTDNNKSNQPRNDISKQIYIDRKLKVNNIDRSFNSMFDTLCKPTVKTIRAPPSKKPFSNNIRSRCDTKAMHVIETKSGNYQQQQQQQPQPKQLQKLKPFKEKKHNINSNNIDKCIPTKCITFDEKMPLQSVPERKQNCDKSIKTAVNNHSVRQPLMTLKTDPRLERKIEPRSQMVDEKYFAEPTAVDVITVDAVKHCHANSTDTDKPATVKKKKLNLQEYLNRKNNEGKTNAMNTGKNAIGDVECGQLQSNRSNQNSDGATQENVNNIKESLYEEIIIVSMGCNTDISLPEFNDIKSNQLDLDEKQHVVAIKSTELLSNIQHRIEKANELSKISSNSLFASIQEEILKKSSQVSLQLAGDSATKPKSDETMESGTDKPEHGENKIIMHLPKDRVKIKTNTIAIQTDTSFHFPLLTKLLPIPKYTGKELCEKGRNPCQNGEADDMKFKKGKTANLNRFYRRNDLSNSSSCSEEGKDMSRNSTNSTQNRRESSSLLQHNNREHDYSKPYHKEGRESRYGRHFGNRKRTVSRSFSHSSENSSRASSSSSTSSSSSRSSTSSSSSMSSMTAKSMNSYGGSSSKSCDGYDHHRAHSQQSNRSNSSRNHSGLSTSPEERCNMPTSRYSIQSGERYSHFDRDTSPLAQERCIVYVGHIELDASKEEIRRKFSAYGAIKNISLHFKEKKWKYGFVTYEHAADAYKAIDCSANNAEINSYDISFGGRRAFCREKYLDLDNTGDFYQLNANSPKVEPNSFEVLLGELKERLKG